MTSTISKAFQIIYLVSKIGKDKQQKKVSEFNKIEFFFFFPRDWRQVVAVNVAKEVKNVSEAHDVISSKTFPTNCSVRAYQITRWYISNFFPRQKERERERSVGIRDWMKRQRRLLQVIQDPFNGLTWNEKKNLNDSCAKHQKFRPLLTNF